MRNELAQNAIVFNAANNMEYTISRVIGSGASCVVYMAEAQDHTQHILKEYNPKHLAVPRNELGALCPGEKEKAYRAGLERFKAGYEKQLHIRRISELTNVTSNIQTIFSANNTEYIDMTCFNGVTFDQIECSSLFDLLCYIKSVARVVAEYHRNGFLHLDIKPENIFTIPETPNFVMLFDFDSITEKDALFTSPVLSYTKSWAAPEQILPHRRNRICEATDIFAIGEILFYKLFGRHSTLEERGALTYSFDREQELLSGLEDYCFELLSKILKNTICTLAAKRYQTIDELLLELEPLIALTNTAALRAYGKIHGFHAAGEEAITALDEKMVHLAIQYFPERYVVWTKLSDSPPPVVLSAALAEYAADITVDDVLVFIKHSLTQKIKQNTIITRDGLYSNHRGGIDYRGTLQPVHFKWNNVERFVRIKNRSHFQTKDKVVHYITAKEEEWLGLQKMLEAYQASFPETQTGESFEEKIIHLVCECVPSSRVLWTKMSDTPPPETLYKAIAAYAPDITVDDVLVFILDSFPKNGKKNTIITREGLYSGCRGLYKKIHFKWKNVVRFLIEDDNFSCYQTKDHVKHFIYFTQKEYLALQQILKAYKDEFPEPQPQGDSFEETIIHLVCDFEPSYNVLWTKMSTEAPPDTLYRAIAAYAPDITVDDVLVFINDSLTKEGRKNTIITREGLYSNSRGISSKPIHFRWEDIDCFFADKHGSCHYKTKAGEEYYFRTFANKKALFGFQQILKAYQEEFSEPQPQPEPQPEPEPQPQTQGESFEEKIICLICDFEPSYNVLWTKMSTDAPPDTLYRAIAAYAPDITVDDVLVFINDSFTNKGRKNTIITREGLYSNSRGISSKPIHFRWEDIDCFFADKHGICHYKTKAGEEYYFGTYGNKKALFGFQQILKAYKMQKNY